MKRALIALVAAGALMAPGAALANHVTDVDGPAVSSINGICHSKPGQMWAASHAQAFTAYWNAGLYSYALEHLRYVIWWKGACLGR